MSWADQTLATLRPNYPQWDLWYVPKVYGSPVWCARPKGTPTATINTDSPESLIIQIAEQEAKL